MSFIRILLDLQAFVHWPSCLQRRPSFFLCLAVLGSVAGTVVGNGYIRQVVSPVNVSSTRHVKRQDTETLANQLTGTIYTLDLDIGTTPQEVTVIIDSASSELRVNPTFANSDNANSVAFCNKLPRFDPSKSTSLSDTAMSNTLNYGKASVNIEYLKDFVTAGGFKTSNSVDIYVGILGVGPRLGASRQSYPCILDSLKSQNFIQSQAFTLNLRSADSAVSSVIFGGIDKGKYCGNLEKVAIIDLSATKDDRCWVGLKSFSTTKVDGITQTFYTGTPLAVFLDSGNTFSYLPTGIYNAIGKSFPSSLLDSGGSWLYIVDCQDAILNASIDFGFGNSIIRVWYKNFIWTIPN
ncbi:hypothetical protein JX265_012358 [Neoarthrinium moseri]|uniref:Peptidase A1 domain-containing protein n=1 Tax=Neoarthrinium moseri TaxID=1658444 RepID=A0A9Q0AIQ1_9PEZI|nr:hypothetical protein JX265_012358 [Neoarthrinium moseri]